MENVKVLKDTILYLDNFYLDIKDNTWRWYSNKELVTLEELYKLF